MPLVVGQRVSMARLGLAFLRRAHVKGGAKVYSARKTRSSATCLLILVVGEASGSQSRCEKVKKEWAGKELVQICPPLFTCSQAGGPGRELSRVVLNSAGPCLKTGTRKGKSLAVIRELTGPCLAEGRQGRGGK